MKKSRKTVAEKASLAKPILYVSLGLLGVIAVVAGFYFLQESTKPTPPNSPAANSAPNTPNPANGSTVPGDTRGKDVIQECDTPCRMDVGYDQMIDTGQKKVLVKFHGRDEWFTLSGRIDDRIPADFFSAGEAEFKSLDGEPSVHVQIKKLK